ncbi:MAG TPA: hypothetical protein VGM12_05190 [Trebonia sp.]|jgi:hypothetical protein
MTSAEPPLSASSPEGRVAESRADRFGRELKDLKIADPSVGRPRLWQRLGAVLMVLGIVLAVCSYLLSHRTSSSLTQGDAVTIGLGGVTLAIVGSAIFLRYSLTGFLRFWMARQSFELNILAERVFTSFLDSPNGASASDAARLTRTDSAHGRHSA